MRFCLAAIGSTDIIVKGFYENEKTIENIFNGKADEMCFLPSAEKDEPHQIYVGLGKQEELTAERLRNAYAGIVKRARECKAKTLTIENIELSCLTETEFLKAIAEGMDLADYKFDKYKSDKKTDEQLEILLPYVPETKENLSILEETKNIVKSIKTARDMTAEPTNRLYPEEFASRARQLAKENGFDIEVFEEEEISELGMEAFLSVAKGSVQKPYFIIMRYLNGGDSEITGLVGKGLTCDTGGYSLKSSESLMYMKSDMSGAANMLAVMSSVAANKCKANVVAVIACCENAVSGGSYKPGDIVGSMAGKTIEVLNTDAEGRLTLADALYYITQKENAARVIDMATLTGVAGTTFGNVYTPVITNNQEFLDEFLGAAKRADEDFWQLPNDKKYRKMIDSNIADIKNTGGAGTITAAMFLQEFVQGKPWIHLDIAATAVLDPSPVNYIPNGASGVAVRTIYELIRGGR